MRISQVFAFRLLPVLERLRMGVHVRQAIIVFHKPPMYVNNVESIRLGLAVILVRNSNTLYSLQIASSPRPPVEDDGARRSMTLSPKSCT